MADTNSCVAEVVAAVAGSLIVIREAFGSTVGGVEMNTVGSGVPGIGIVAWDERLPDMVAQEEIESHSAGSEARKPNTMLEEEEAVDVAADEEEQKQRKN